MNRELKRVPLDFDWKIGKKWFGYEYLSFCNKCKDCEDCRKFARTKGQIVSDVECPSFPELEALIEPPKGAGYQLWETTTEGSPKSPVFSTLDELCEWCELNATTFANYKTTKEKWKTMLTKNIVFVKRGLNN